MEYVNVNIKRYEPLCEYQSEAERTYLLDTGLADPQDNVARLSREAFEEEKIQFYVSYLLGTTNALKQLGLVCPIDHEAMAKSHRKSALGEATRGAKTRAKKVSPAKVLRSYCRWGVAQVPPPEYCPKVRDKKVEETAKNLLKSAIAAWTRTVERKMYKQLNLNLTEKLLEAIDKAYEEFRSTMEGKGKSRNTMLAELLEKKFLLSKAPKRKMWIPEHRLGELMPNSGDTSPESLLSSGGVSAVLSIKNRQDTASSDKPNFGSIHAPFSKSDRKLSDLLKAGMKNRDDAEKAKGAANVSNANSEELHNSKGATNHSEFI